MVTLVPIESVSYAVCAVAFLILTLLVAFSKTRTAYRRLMGLGCATTTLWAGAIAAMPWLGLGPMFVAVVEVARTVTWILFLGSLLGDQGGVRLAGIKPRVVSFGVAVAAVLMLAGYLPGYFDMAPEFAAPLAKFSDVTRLLLLVIGLMLLENLFRNTGADSRWATKYLCLGLGALFTYDFVMYADAVLFSRIDPTLFAARGLVDSIVVPLLAVAVTRANAWRIDIHVSRKGVFHSVALIGSGLYLLVTAAAGLYLKSFGGDWGSIFQIIFVTGGLLFLLVLFSSGSLRARIKVLINKHFFSYRYDYREEWLRFIQTISMTERSVGLHDRVIRTLADIVDSTAGGLWVYREDDAAYFPTAVWNFTGQLPAERGDSALVEFLERSLWVLDLDEFKDHPLRYGSLSMPQWLLNHPKVWLVVPLVHRNKLHAFLVLGRPRTRRALEWEDYDLLKTVGRQAASYLAEEHAIDVLFDARRLEAFNRRFAFVAHDIKNLVSQMSLMLQNAERFGHNPEFQKDMVNTIRNSVARLKGLLEQLNAERKRDDDQPGRVRLRGVVEQVAIDWRKQKPDLAVDLGSSDGEVAADRQQIVTVLDHLLQNAIEAVGENGKISLRLKIGEADAVIEVEDDGPGMEADFIRDQLFSPLNSGKRTGYGLGAYQTRQLVREMDGRLEVLSTPGEGTVMQVFLPLPSDRRPDWMEPAGEKRMVGS